MYYNWKAAAATDELRRMVDLRIPYPDIGKRLGISVGAVCGKVHRLGIGKGPHKPDRLFVRPSKPKRPQIEPDAAYLEIIERQKQEAIDCRGLTIALEKADPHHCRYVIGDPTKRQLCGAHRHMGTPYCEDHAKLCLSPISLKTRNAASEAAAKRPWRGFPYYYLTLGAPIDARTFEEADAPEPAIASPA